MTGRPSNSLVLFLHFHRAGGTSVVSAFKSNPDFQLHRPHLNGNPWKRGHEELIKFWEFELRQFESWVSRLRESGTHFIASEWNFFADDEFMQIDRIEWITCLRDPWKRFLSNYRTDGADKRCRLGDYSAQELWWRRRGVSQTFKVTYNRPNYYVRMLNALGEDWDADLTDEHLRVAKRRLARFDTVLILEQSESFAALKKYQCEMPHVNKESRSAEILDSNEYAREFESRNRLDRELYEYARTLVSGTP